MDKILHGPNCDENISNDKNLPVLFDVLMEGFTHGDLDSHHCLKNVALTVIVHFLELKFQYLQFKPQTKSFCFHNKICKKLSLCVFVLKYRQSP